MARSRAELDAIRKLHALADRLTPELRRRLDKALAGLQDSASLAEIERALRTSDAFLLHDLASTLPSQLSASVAVLAKIFAQGADVGRQLLLHAAQGARIGMRFDSTNLFAQAAAKRSAAELVTRITQETRKAIRSMVVRGFADGTPPRELARLIKPIIGLTEKQALAVAKLKSRLIAEGLSQTATAERVASVASRYRRARALTIARTEVIRASADGQMAAWQEAVGKGLLAASSQKVWITTADDRLCRFCRPLDGTVATLGTKFRTALGRVDGPPLHPNCRCAIAVQPMAVGKRQGRAA